MIGKSLEGLKTSCHHLQVYPMDLREAKEERRAAESPDSAHRHSEAVRHPAALPCSAIRPKSPCKPHLNFLPVEDAGKSVRLGFLQGHPLRGRPVGQPRSTV